MYLRSQNRHLARSLLAILLVFTCTPSLFADIENHNLSIYLQHSSKFMYHEDENRLNRIAGDAKKTRDKIYDHLDENIKKVLTLPENMSVKARGDFNHVQVDFVYKIY